MQDQLADRFNKVQASIKDSFYNSKKQYDQSTVGKLHKDLSLWYKFAQGVSWSAQWLYKTFLRPITKRLWRVFKWLAVKYRNGWMSLTYKMDQYGSLQFSKVRGACLILATLASFYFIYGVLTIACALPWYFLTVKHDEVLYLSNHSAVEGHHGSSRVKINEVYEITGCETLNCSDQDTVSFRVEASWFNELWSLIHNGALYYPDYVAAAVSPVVNRCIITSYGIRKKFLVRYWELHPDILQVKCLPVGIEDKDTIHNKDYR